jgi:hypothetical protein
MSLSSSDNRASGGDEMEILKKAEDKLRPGEKKAVLVKFTADEYAILMEMVRYAGTDMTDVIKKALQFVYENQFAGKKKA